MFVKLNIDESKYEYRINFVWKPLLIRVAPFSGRKCEISWIIFSSHDLVAIPRQRKTVAVNNLRRYSTFCRIPPSLRILFNRYTFQKTSLHIFKEYPTVHVGQIQIEKYWKHWIFFMLWFNLSLAPLLWYNIIIPSAARIIIFRPANVRSTFPPNL